MRTGTLLTIVIIGCAARARLPGGLKEISDLSLRGAGCHVDLLAPDGSVICKAIASPLSRCFPLEVMGTGSEGETKWETFYVGSTCPRPRLTSVEVGGGQYIVDSEGGVFSVICDNATPCRRYQQREKIDQCCNSEDGLKDTAVCTVPRTAAACMPREGADTGVQEQEAVDIGER